MKEKLGGIIPYLAHFHAPPRDRYEEGRSRREAVSVHSHAETISGSKRAGPLEILQQQNLDQNRVQELIPLRFGRMSYSPFTYLRGA